MKHALLAATAVAALIAATPAWAQFVPGGSTISTAVTTAQTLSAGTGTVTSAGSITTSGGTVGVTMSGSATLSNAGVIQQTGSGRAVDSNTNNISLVVGNSGSILTVSADAMRVNTANTSINLTNSGTISVSAGGQAIDWANIATAANALTNTATGVISAVGEDAVRPGQNGTITNAGSITATPTVSGGSASGSDGIDLRTQKTVSVTNTGSITGRHGIATDGANVGPSSLAVQNNAGTIQGLNGSGVNVDANTALPSATTVTANITNAFGATIKGGLLASTTDGDGDGIDVDGVLTLTNSGDVLGLGAKGLNNPEGIAAGGGSITNTATGRIIGSALLADAPNGDGTKIGSGILIDDSNGGSAVAATTINNSGLIEGKSGFAVKINGTFANSITNEAGGTLRGAGAQAAVQGGDGVDTVINRGAVIGSGGSAIDLRGGNDSLTIQGGAASVSGNISGGAGTNTLAINPGAGNSFSYGGTLSNFSSVEVQSGTVTLSGANTYTGATRITGGVLRLDGANRIAAASALHLEGGTLEMANIGAADGQTFASLALTESSVLDLGFTTTLTFNDLGAVIAGKTLAIEHYLAALSADYAIRFLGDLTLDADFLALIGMTTVNGHTAGYSYDGQYTLVQQVPEPASLAVLALAATACGVMRRRGRPGTR